MKKKILLFLVLVLMLFLVGCYDTQVRMDFDQEGNIDLKTEVTGGNMTSKSDMNLVYWQLRTIFPELETNYRTDRENKEIKFERINSISYEKIEAISFEKSNGIYEFEMKIPPIYSEKDDSDH